MPSAKQGTAGSPVAPADPVEASDADDADPGAVESTKATQRATQTGKYGTFQTKPFTPPPEDPPPAEDPATSDPSSTATDTDPPKHWIEIVVTDEKGNPMPGESYNLLLPDGTTASGTLDEKGFMRLDGIAAGNCTFSLPNRQDDEWHA